MFVVFRMRKFTCANLLQRKRQVTLFTRIRIIVIGMSRPFAHSMHSNPLSDTSADAMHPAQIVGRNVERLRKKEKLTKATFAAMVPVSRPHLNRIEKGEADLRLSTIIKLADALDTTYEDLLRIHD